MIARLPLLLVLIENSPVCGHTIELRMLVLSTLLALLINHCRSAVFLHPSIVADSLHFPADFDIWGACHDHEPVAVDLPRHLDLYKALAARVIHNGQLVARQLVDFRKVIRQFDPSLAFGIGGHVAVVDVLGFRPLRAVV